MGIPMRWSERGGALTLTAVSLTALIGAAAIAIDLGMLYKARGDAERAAEAGALAGASAFMDLVGADSLTIHNAADTRARELAMANGILNKQVVAGEVQSVSVRFSEQLVRVTVGRTNVGTWFAKILGAYAIPVNATAAARVEGSDEVSCVKPFMIPDAWGESAQDANDNGLEDPAENWTFDPASGDTYAPFESQPLDVETGFGSDFRNAALDASNRIYAGDFGRQLTLTPGDPGNASGTPDGMNSYRLWTFDGGSTGNPDLRQAIEGCREGSLGLGDLFQSVPGAPSGLDVANSVQQLINRDPGAHYDETTGVVEGSSFPDWRSSPRVMRIALYDPSDMATLGNGPAPVQFNNVALFFLEGVDANAAISGRFYYYVNGAGSPASGGSSGSLVKHVRLVE